MATMVSAGAVTERSEETTGRGPAAAPDPAAATLAAFEVSDPVIVARTGAACVWQVRRIDGSLAALKLYHRGDMGNEAAGYNYLRDHDGKGVARIFVTTADAVLMEWLPGQSLADQFKAGDPDGADTALARVAATLLARHVPSRSELTGLEPWFAALFSQPTQTEASSHPLMNASRRIARTLLDSQDDRRPLHGDLHHGNVLETSRGPVAFDAKGLLGDPAYELANAFRHPLVSVETCDPVRIRARATLWSDALNVSPGRLLGWAASKCALSIAWRGAHLSAEERELDLLAALLQQADASSL